MAFNKRHNDWTKKRLRELALSREELKRKLRSITTKPVLKTGSDGARVVIVGQPNQTHAEKKPGLLRAFAEMIKRGWASLHPAVALPQAVKPQADQHGVEPVVAHPYYPDADAVVRTSLSGPIDSGSNLRGLIDCYNRPHTGWRTRGRS
jgi:hypothetical protein